MSNCLIRMLPGFWSRGYTILMPKSKRAIMLTPVLPTSENCNNHTKQHLMAERARNYLQGCFLVLDLNFSWGKTNDSQGCDANLDLRDE